jgi:hypothetical protein
MQGMYKHVVIYKEVSLSSAAACGKICSVCVQQLFTAGMWGCDCIGEVCNYIQYNGERGERGGIHIYTSWIRILERVRSLILIFFILESEYVWFCSVFLSA